MGKLYLVEGRIWAQKEFERLKKKHPKFVMRIELNNRVSQMIERVRIEAFEREQSLRAQIKIDDKDLDEHFFYDDPGFEKSEAQLRVDEAAEAREMCYDRHEDKERLL